MKPGNYPGGGTVFADFQKTHNQSVGFKATLEAALRPALERNSALATDVPNRAINFMGLLYAEIVP